MCTQDVVEWTTCGTKVPIGKVKECPSKGKKDNKGKVICTGEDPKDNVIKLFSGICKECK